MPTVEPSSTSKSMSSQRHERLVRDPAEVDHPLLQRRVVLVVQLNCFETLADLDRGAPSQSSSAKFASERPNTRTAIASTMTPNAND